MGNYGNTLDGWYRRAAVVVWPRERAFAVRGEAGSRWALEELRGGSARGDLDRATLVTVGSEVRGAVGETDHDREVEANDVAHLSGGP